MKVVKRILVGLTFYCSCTAVVLLCVAFGTQYWIQSEAVRMSVNFTESDRGKGKVHFGLFEGVRDLNHGFGERVNEIRIVCLPSDSVCIWSYNASRDSRLEEIKSLLTNVNSSVKNEYDKDPVFIDFKLWVATIIFLSLAVLFGVVGAGFSILNVISTPIEWITGVRGLYVWNSVAAGFTLISVVLWSILYYNKFKDNVMGLSDLQLGWTSKDKASFGYSFWIVVGAMLLYVINLVIVFVWSIEPEMQKRTKAVVNEKPADGIIMLF